MPGNVTTIKRQLFFSRSVTPQRPPIVSANPRVVVLNERLAGTLRVGWTYLEDCFASGFPVVMEPWSGGDWGAAAVERQGWLAGWLARTCAYCSPNSKPLHRTPAPQPGADRPGPLRQVCHHLHLHVCRHNQGAARVAEEAGAPGKCCGAGLC